MELYDHAPDFEIVAVIVEGVLSGELGLAGSDLLRFGGLHANELALTLADEILMFGLLDRSRSPSTPRSKALSTQHLRMERTWREST